MEFYLMHKNNVVGSLVIIGGKLSSFKLYKDSYRYIPVGGSLTKERFKEW